jgi:hypothetical protein
LLLLKVPHPAFDTYEVEENAGPDGQRNHKNDVEGILGQEL